MSRIGKKTISVPEKVTIEFDPQTRICNIKGPLGELNQPIMDFVSVNLEGQEIDLTIKDEKNRLQKSIWGTTRALINNMIVGVTNGYTKELELNGVGYRMELSGSELTLFVGFSHSIKIPIPQGIKLSLNKNILSGTSIDKQLIGNFFSSIHNIKPCEPYKHKGFKFPGRFYAKKVGKKGSKK